MGIFTRSKNLPAVVDAPRARVIQLDEEDRDRYEMAELEERLAARITAEMRKSLSYASYVAFDNVDDQSGYFGTEFEIRTTAGRLKGLYSREPWIYTAATQVAKTLATIPLKVWNPATDKVVENHWLQALLDAGSPTQSCMELRWTEGIDLMLGGNFFLILEENLKAVAGMAPVEQVELVYKPDFSALQGIRVHQVGGGAKAAYFPIEQVVHVKLPNPSNFLYGMSPFAAAARPILLDRYKNEYEMAFYLRGATHQGVIETTEDLSKSRFQRLMRTFEQAFTGRSNWWRTLFLPKGAKWQASSLTMNEMQHLESLKENRKTILAVLGIPPSIVGLIEDVNRATSEQQERIYWNNTIVPFAHFVASGWNNSHIVKGLLKSKVEVRPDFSGIEAVEGFTSAKKERAEAMAPYFTIDEIREKVWGGEPLGDERGMKLVAEIKSSAAPGIPGQLALSQKAVVPDAYVCICVMCPKDIFTREAAITWAKSKNYKVDHVEEASDHWRLQQRGPDSCEPETIKTFPLDDGCSGLYGIPKEIGEQDRKLAAKATATGSQNRIEARLSREMEAAYRTYIDEILSEAKKAIEEKRHVREYLTSYSQERASLWMQRVMPTLEAAMERGFSAASAQVRDARALVKEKRFPGLDETDKQAVDVLRERQRDGRRRVLAERSIERFSGLDSTRTEQVMQIIEDGEKAGRSYEEIARTIREDYGEAYDGQARLIVRQEILSAVSEGLDWNHQVLGQIFSQVGKGWFHNGDEGINSDARPEHVALDGTEVAGDAKFTYVDEKTGELIELGYPRDSKAPAGAVIGCRCTMYSVIPESASSNAEAILNS